MQDDIDFWKSTIKEVIKFQKMVEKKAGSATSARTKVFEKKLKEHLEELRKFCEKELSYYEFMEIILEDDWARRMYYNNPKKEGDENA